MNDDGAMAEAPGGPAPARYETLDAWRGLACASVVLFHAVGRYVDESHAGPAFLPLRLVDRGGWLGVPLFFTISGWCIAAAARPAGLDASPRATFFRRRARRILPTFWITLAAAALLGLLGHAIARAGGPAWIWDRTEIGWHWATNALLLEEPLRSLAIEPAYGNAPTWSLCYEAQFYAFMGLAVVGASPRARVLALASLTAASVVLVARFGTLRLGLLTDVWPLLALGVWAHERTAATDRRARALWDATAAATVAGALVAYALSTGRLGQEAKQIAICAAFAAALLALRPLDARLAGRPAVAALSALGRRSYTVYLVHFPIVMSLGDAMHALGWTRGAGLYATAGLSAVVAGSIAWALYRVVERPFTSRSRPRPAPAA